jgi:hypothetical protein
MRLREKVRTTANKIAGFLNQSQRGDPGLENPSAMPYETLPILLRHGRHAQELPWQSREALVLDGLHRSRDV